MHLIGIEQDRCDRERTEPAPRPATQQQNIDDHGHRQADQVLDGDDQVEVADGQDRAQHAAVAERIHAGRLAQQVPGSVYVKERRAVRKQGQDPKH